MEMWQCFHHSVNMDSSKLGMNHVMASPEWFALGISTAIVSRLFTTCLRPLKTTTFLPEQHNPKQEWKQHTLTISDQKNTQWLKNTGGLHGRGCQQSCHRTGQKVNLISTEMFLPQSHVSYFCCYGIIHTSYLVISLLVQVGSYFFKVTSNASFLSVFLLLSTVMIVRMKILFIK